MVEFYNKTVVITGGSRGIGQSCCRLFAQMGANVIFTYNKSQKEAVQLCEEISKNCFAVAADVKDYEQCREVIKRAIQKFGQVDILINNAGITRDKALMMMTGDDWRDVVVIDGVREGEIDITVVVFKPAA